MRWICCALAIGAIGCGKEKVTSLPKSAPLNARQAARPELMVLEQAGRWEQQNEVVGADGVTNRTTAVLNASWALNGHCLLLETEVNSGHAKAHELIIKHFNTAEGAKAQPYQCTWFQDDGLVRGFTGSWDGKRSRLAWKPAYLPGAPEGMGFDVTEIYTGPDTKVLDFVITESGKTTVQGRSLARRTGPSVVQHHAAPLLKEHSRLGQGGMWKEEQTTETGDSQETISLISRLRWHGGGKFLVNEGVVDPKGKPEYFLWVKSWDNHDGVYRWAYIFQDGPVDHFVGYWVEAQQHILWRSVRPGLVIELIEKLENKDRRTWTFTVRDAAGNVQRGAGVSDYQGLER